MRERDRSDKKRCPSKRTQRTDCNGLNNSENSKRERERERPRESTPGESSKNILTIIDCNKLFISLGFLLKKSTVAPSHKIV